MTTAQRTLTHLIVCPVCMEDMGQHNKPKVFQCQHTVCEKCVTRLDQRCPLCRVSFPQNSSEDLPTNLTNLQLCDVIRQMNNESKKLCDYCQHDPQVPTHYCKDCTDYLCSRCAKYHREIFEDHIPVPITSSHCTKHGKAYTMFCMDCHILLCTVCVHQNVCCSNKNKQKLQDIIVQKKQDLINLVRRMSFEIQYNKEIVVPSKTTLNERLNIIDDIRLNVRTHMQNLQARLKEKENELMEEINKYERDVLEIQRSVDLRIDNDRLSQLKETAEEALAAGTEQILLTLPSIKAALTQTASTRVEIVIPGPIRFQPQNSLQVGKVLKDRNEVFYGEDFMYKIVYVIDERSDVGGELWDVVFVKESVMAVTDYKKNVVLLMDSQGHILKDSHKQGVKIQDPRGIAYHPKLDCLVVCERSAHCLCMLDPNTLSLTKKVQLKQLSPWGVAVMSNGNIVLTECDKRMVGVFDMNGTQLYSWQTYNNGASRFDIPIYLTVDRDNNIYVAEFASKKIVKLSKTGEMLCEWQTEGDPGGLTVCGDKVLVAEFGSHDSVIEYSVKGGPGRGLLSWHSQRGFCKIRSIAIHQDQLAVIGPQGLRIYKLT